MKTAQLNGKTIGFIEVPSEAKDFEIVKNNIGIWVQCITYTPLLIPIPKGNWRIVALSTDVTEEMARELVLARVDQSSFPTSMEYYDYLSNNMVHLSFNFKTSLEAFNSLKVSLGVVDVNPIPKPEYQFDEHGNGGYCETWLLNYEEAQQQVKTYLVLIKDN